LTGTYNMELKPCPFCGSAVRYIEATKKKNKLIFCPDCTATFRLALICPKDELIEAWNIRKDKKTDPPV
jgi:Lar family restriction alleviation protein